MTERADGRVALVTGAARGIGASVARRFAAAGWAQVLVDVCADDPALAYPLSTRPDLDTMVAACGPELTEGVVADVRDRAALAAAAAVARDRFGGLDAVVAAAGAIAGGHDAWHTDASAWEAMVGVNLTGVWNTAGATVPVLLERPEPRAGRFVAVASAGGILGLPKLAAYSAAKHGVIGLIRSLAAELAPMGVTVNAVAPGSTDTAMLDASAAVYGLESTDEFAHHHLQQRLVQPDEVAAAVVWLCGPDSSGVIGAVVPVDAGMTAG
jgi:SDR family mycofactocin-dependent oxidoreductase